MIYLIIFIRTSLLWILSYRSIPPGVLHLCCVIVARKRLVDDVDVGDDDMAMEVQTINSIRHKILTPFDFDSLIADTFRRIVT